MLFSIRVFLFSTSRCTLHIPQSFLHLFFAPFGEIGDGYGAKGRVVRKGLSCSPAAITGIANTLGKGAGGGKENLAECLAID